MNKSLFSPRGFLIPVFLFLAVPVLAQSGNNTGGDFGNPTSSAITNILIDKMTERRTQKKPAARRSGSSSGAAASGTAAPRVNEGSVSFRPTGSHLRVREVGNLIAAGNVQVLNLLTALLEEYEKNARAAGRPNDLALALSFFLATNASLYHATAEPTDPQMLELRDVIAEALIEGNAMDGVTDRQKQEMYETLVLITGFALATYEEGKQGGNAETVNVSRQLAGQNLLAITGIPPDKIAFTAQGLDIEREPAGSATVTQPAVQTSQQSAPAASVNAGKLVIDFEGNEVRANQLYSGKRIRINGTVNSIDILKDGRISLTFHSPAMGYAQTRCYFNKSQSSRVAGLQGGQVAIVEGTVRGIGGGLGGRGFVEVENCTVP